MSDKSKKAEQFLKEAYSTDDEVGQLQFYKKWADDYDQQMQEGLQYLSPLQLAADLADYFLDKNAPLLDVGCGTGLTAAAMVELGYDTIDGLDYSAEMVEVAGQKCIYRELFVADLNLPLEIADRSYAAIISSGTFTHGHVGPEPIDELVRILNPDGFLACTVHCDLWQEKGFEVKFAKLEAKNRIQKLRVSNKAYFKDADPDGKFCVYQKI